MTIWKLGTSGGKYSDYNELKARNIIAQGWDTGDLTFLFRENESLIRYWLNILLPGKKMGIDTLTNLLHEMNAIDLVLAYDGQTLKGICEIPTDFIYKFEDKHSACTIGGGVCKYTNCLFPVKLVDWTTLETSVGRKVPYPGTGQLGVHGITGSDRSYWDGIQTAWNEYKTKTGFNPQPSGTQLTELHKLQANKEKKMETRYQELSCNFIKSKSISLKEQLEVIPQMILYGPPGTGKTFTAKAIAAQFLGIDPCKIFEKDSDEEVEFELNKFSDTNPNGLWDIVQFHPNYSYEDFIGGIRPDLKSGTLQYVLVSGRFKKFCDMALSNPDKKFVFIIDEINRANLSAVFGELLYALEYRGESMTIPNFGNFTVPKNVYVIGTMNNVDKSLVTFDIALRRRFSFEIINTDTEIVRIVLYKKYGLTDKIGIDDYVAKCKTLNERIVKELDLAAEQQIGHDYFIRISKYINHKKASFGNSSNIEECKQLLWKYHLEPLLEEYLGTRFLSQMNKLKDIKDKFIG